jgi:hypothetical protein
MSTWDAAQRRALVEAAGRGEPLVCPACGSTVTSSRVTPPPEVSYVRRRLLLICGGCHRSAAIDTPGPGR